MECAEGLNSIQINDCEPLGTLKWIVCFLLFLLMFALSSDNEVRVISLVLW